MRVSAEHSLQNNIRNALAGIAHIFRANVGRGWTSSRPPLRTQAGAITVTLHPGDVLLRQARPFDTGLPPGFGDLFGFVPVVVTPDMVGTTVPIYVGLEVKDAGKATPQQQAYLRAVQNNGGRAGVVRSVDEAVKIVKGKDR